MGKRGEIGGDLGVPSWFAGGAVAELEAIGSGVVEDGGAVSRRRSRQPCPGMAVANGDDVAATAVAVELPAACYAPSRSARVRVSIFLGFLLCSSRSLINASRLANLIPLIDSRIVYRGD